MISLSAEPSPTRRAFAYFMRTGTILPDSSFAPLEAKFNPNHDPTNGQFTSGPGGGRESGQRRVRALASNSTLPFSPHPREQPIDHEVSDKLNRLVASPDAKEAITIAGAPLSFERMGSNIVRVTGLNGQVSIEGHFEVRANQVIFSLGQPQVTGIARMAKIDSFPTSLTVYRALSGHMVYSINKAVSVRSFLGGIDQKAGSYLFKH